MQLMTKKRINTLFRFSLIGLLLVFLSVFTIDIAFASPQQQEGPVYIVQQGDTLSSIALRFGISAEELQNANNIADPNALDIGQHLVIPGLEGITGLLTSEVLPYGTSLTGLTRQYQLNRSNLITLNRITSPSETIAGIKFIIAINENEDPLSPVMMITAGETSLEASIRAVTSPWSLVADNQLAATWDMLPGETLYGRTEDDVTIANLPDLNEIDIDPLPIIQGETVLIGLTSNSEVEFIGSFNGEPLHFFSDDGEHYYGFLGIHALADPGPFPLKITATYPDGTEQSFEQLTLLSPGDYGNEWVFVPDDYLDEAAITEEDNYLQPILRQVTPDRDWEGRFQYPIDEPCINSLFGQRRNYNDGELFFYHTGLDFAVCAPNLNVYAPAAGRVVLAEELTIKGNAILIDHGWGIFSAYAHLSEITVQVGDLVETGDLLGLIGNTGRSAGPHLHFEIIISGNPVNPQTWLDQEFP